MTVAEIIEKLKEFPPEMPVCTTVQDDAQLVDHVEVIKGSEAWGFWDGNQRRFGEDYVYL